MRTIAMVRMFAPHPGRAADFPRKPLFGGCGQSSQTCTPQRLEDLMFLAQSTLTQRLSSTFAFAKVLLL